MSYGAGICDPGTSNTWAFCRSSAALAAVEDRPSRFYVSWPLLPPVVDTAPTTIAFAARNVYTAVIPTYTDDSGQVKPAYLEEKHATRKTNATKDMRTMQRTFLIHGTDDPAACADLGPQPLDVFEEDSSLAVESRDCQWYASGEGSDEYKMCILVVNYRTRELNSGAEPLLEFQYGAESEHVTQAFHQFTDGPDDVLAFDNGRFKTSVNVTDKGVKGLEIQAPIIDFSEEHVFTEAQFNSAYRMLLRDMAQKTNSGFFRDFSPEEVLFTGVTAKKSVNKWILTFNFRARRTQNVSLTLTSKDGKDVPTTVTKLGWRYLWIEMRERFQNQVGDRSRIRQSYPHAVSVAQVYDTADFSLLGIGVDSIP